MFFSDITPEMWEDLTENERASRLTRRGALAYALSAESSAATFFSVILRDVWQIDVTASHSLEFAIQP